MYQRVSYIIKREGEDSGKDSGKGRKGEEEWDPLASGCGHLVPTACRPLLGNGQAEEGRRLPTPR